MGGVGVVDGVYYVILGYDYEVVGDQIVFVLQQIDGVVCGGYFVILVIEEYWCYFVVEGGQVQGVFVLGEGENWQIGVNV